MVLPLFLLFGLFLFSASSVMAQNFKPLNEAAEIVRGELIQVVENGGHSYDVQATNGVDAQLVARFEYFSYLMKTLKTDNVELAVEETFSKMQIKFPNSPMNNAIVIAHNRAVDLLSND